MQWKSRIRRHSIDRSHRMTILTFKTKTLLLEKGKFLMNNRRLPPERGLKEAIISPSIDRPSKLPHCKTCPLSRLLSGLAVRKCITHLSRSQSDRLNFGQ